MSGKIRQLFAVMAVFALTACSGSGDEEGFSNNLIENGGNGENVVRSAPIQLPESFSGVLVDVLDSKCYQPKEFAEALANQQYIASYSQELGDVTKYLEPVFRLAVNARVPKMNELFEQEYGKNAKWQVERYVFTYRSVSSYTGADTVLVGAVTFPNNTVSGLNHEVGTLTCHHHQAAFDESWLPSYWPSTMTLHALHNSAVIEPDFLGGGSDIMKLSGDYLNGDALSLQMANCAMAALDLMRQHGVKLADNGYTNNFGSSLGIPSTLGFAQYMENEAPDELANALRLKETFAGEGITKLSHLNFAGAERFPTPPYKYNMGWKPKNPVYMACCPNDNFVSYTALKAYCEELAVNADGTVNPDIHWTDFNVVNTEIQEKIGGNHFVAAILMLFYMSMAEDPADMPQLLR